MKTTMQAGKHARVKAVSTVTQDETVTEPPPKRLRSNPAHDTPSKGMIPAEFALEMLRVNKETAIGVATAASTAATALATQHPNPTFTLPSGNLSFDVFTSSNAAQFLSNSGLNVC